MSQSKIQSTTNYSKFKFMEGNRVVNEERVKKLMKAMKRKNLLPQFPIVCQKNSTGLYVMDGQTRYTAAQRLGLPVHWIETKNLEIADVSASNSVQKGWLVKDFVHSFAMQGNDHYIKLRDFVHEHRLPFTTAANILAGDLVDSAGTQAGKISLGTFKVTDLPFANRVAAAVKACLNYFKDAKARGFVMAISRLLKVPGFSITRLIQKLEHQGTRLVRCATWIQYVELIEEIYNYKCRSGDIMALSIEVKRMLAK